MKKIFSTKKSIIVLISLLIFLAFSAFSVAAIEIFKQSDPVPKGDNYGAYYDDAKFENKVRTIEVNSEKITLKYVRTENLKEKPVSKRADSYGTYDVYMDDNQTEYLYLLNSDVYCGFKLSTVGVATPQENAIIEAEALAIASSFLKDMRSNSADYKLMSCVYDELAGYYDIQYYLPINGYKSDDIFRLWVDAKGKITSFSEFNYKRYSNVNISQKKYAEANRELTEKISNETKNLGISVTDSYISIDESGNIILVKVIDLKIPNGNNYVTRREVYSQPIE